MSDTYQSWDDKPYPTDYLITETVIDHPVDVLWPHVVDIGSWMTSHELEPIDGTPGTEGHLARVRPRGLADDVQPPHHHLYGIAKIVPQKAVILEVFPEKGGSYGNAHYPPEHISFDSVLLTDLTDRTHLTFLMIDMYVQRDEAAKAPILQMLHGYFDNLRRLCDG